MPALSAVLVITTVSRHCQMLSAWFWVPPRRQPHGDHKGLMVHGEEASRLTWSLLRGTQTPQHTALRGLRRVRAVIPSCLGALFPTPTTCLINLDG